MQHGKSAPGLDPPPAVTQTDLGIIGDVVVSNLLRGAPPVGVEKAEMKHEDSKSGSNCPQNEVGGGVYVGGYGNCQIVDLGVHRALVRLPDGSLEEIDVSDIELDPE